MFDQTHLDAYADAIINDYAEYNKRSDNGQFSCSISFETGKKYIRVVRDNYGQRSVHSFVDITSGDVYKAASWKVPAKNIRGNVLNLTPNVARWTGAT